MPVTVSWVFSQKALIASLEPFRELGTDIELIKPTKHISYILGVADAKAMEVIESIESCLDTHIGLETFGAEGARAVIIACQSIDYEPVMRMLKETGFVEFMPPKLTGTFSQNIEKEKAKLTSISERLEEINKQLAEAAKKRAELDMAADAYAIERDRAQGDAALSVSEYAYVLDGWARADRLDDIKAAIESVTDAYYMDTRDPLDDETPPSVTRNSKLIEPFEVITEMYALPSYRGMDAAAVMAPFYFLFFGMMLSDAGYGLVMVLGCGIILHKFKNMEEGLRKTLTMFLYCGISTIFWGILFGSFFGDAITVIAKTFFNTDIVIPPLWFTPVDEPMRLLLFSFLVGIIHLFAGLGAQFYQLAKQGKWLDAIYDVVFWYLLVGGAIIYLLSMQMFADMVALSFTLPASVGTAGIIAAGIGAVGIVLTSGRSSKSIGKRFLKGLYGLYGVSSYLSDILSYSRLLALGLATGVIASVFNQMGAMPGNNPLGVIIFIFAFVVGHTLNIGINVLGAYVHTNRLQFVEFFGKFFEGGGRKFAPFTTKTKYFKITEEK